MFVDGAHTRGDDGRDVGIAFALGNPIQHFSFPGRKIEREEGGRTKLRVDFLQVT
jgi:hypothetical protein